MPVPSNKIMPKKLNFKKMVEEIDVLTDTEFCFNMELKLLPLTEKNKTCYTQKEAQKMVELLSSIYSVAHCIHCKACQTRYLE